jgi:hypothetical protein
MTKLDVDLHKPFNYEDLPAMLEAEAKRRDADGKCWMIIDLGDGDAAMLAWFGTPAKMAKLRRLLEALPRVECSWLFRNTSSDKLCAALNGAAKQAKAKQPRRATRKKARR